MTGLAGDCWGLLVIAGERPLGIAMYAVTSDQLWCIYAVRRHPELPPRRAVFCCMRVSSDRRP